jgi:NADH-quinone oxidoreductase subunit G
MDTVTLTIDGRQITVEKGKTVLQAAIEAGISVPYYCYHPGISVDGPAAYASSRSRRCRSCRLVLHGVHEGMVVSTRDPRSSPARAGVFEFLLVNHRSTARL